MPDVSLISFPALMTNFVTDTSRSNTACCNESGDSVNVLDMIIGKTGGTIGETSMIGAIVIGACILIMLGIIDLKNTGYLYRILCGIYLPVWRTWI